MSAQRITERLAASDVGIARAAEILRGGGLVAMPTETVYGLGANALNPIAVAKIFAVKERPTFDPLIVHVADRAALNDLLTAESLADPRIAALAGALWPGPLTIVAAASTAIPSLVRSGLPTVGVRIPDHPVALALIRAAGVPIAAPSANRFGRLSPTRAEHVLADLDGRIDAVIDAGATRVGVESTVVALDPGQPATLLRPGGVSLEQLQSLLAPLGGIQVGGAVQAGSTPLPAPGMTAAHYAPRAPIRLSNHSTESAAPSGDPFAGLGHCALLGLDRDDLDRLEAEAKRAHVPVVAALPLSEVRDPVAAAASLFDLLHRLDAALVSVTNGGIVATLYPASGLGLAIADRLRRAAAASTNGAAE
ncbi:MAG: L-threonylcarbamoyladenylate synthase [Candidatus Limnocylindrus sp.]